MAVTVLTYWAAWVACGAYLSGMVMCITLPRMITIDKDWCRAGDVYIGVTMCCLWPLAIPLLLAVAYGVNPLWWLEPKEVD